MSGRWLSAFVWLVLDGPVPSGELRRPAPIAAVLVRWYAPGVGAAAQRATPCPRSTWPHRYPAESAIQFLKQASGIGAEAVRAKLKGLPVGQLRQASGQFGDVGHSRPVNQNRDHADTMRERHLDLQPHEIRGVIEAPLPTFADGRQPPRTNHCQEHLARPDRGRDLLNEIVAQRNRIDIPEDMVVTEVVD